jgi:Kef-type K+ transport system membrane component KefB
MAPMSAADFVAFLLQLGVMLACGVAGGYLMRRLGQPVVLGEMLGGIVLGPTLFGWLAPDAYAWLFTSSASAAVLRGGVVKLGMLFFMFLVGLEIRFDQLARHGYAAVLVGMAGMLAPLLIGAAAVYALPAAWGPQAAAHRLAYALFIGAAMANTANPVLARILLDLGLLKQGIGAMLMAATVVDDLMSWSLLAMIFSQFSPPGNGHGDVLQQLGGLGGVIAYFAIVLALGRWGVLPLVHSLARRTRRSAVMLAAAAILILAAGASAEQLGIHALLGPFLLGIALSSTQEDLRHTYHAISEFASGFFVPLYFVSMGITSNFIREFDPLLVLLVLVVACGSKLFSVYVAGRVAGLDRRTALGVGFGMNARGATGIILAAVGRDQGVINEPVYVALVLMAIFTSVLAAPAMRLLLLDASAGQEAAPSTNRLQAPECVRTTAGQHP